MKEMVDRVRSEGDSLQKNVGDSMRLVRSKVESGLELRSGSSSSSGIGKAAGYWATIILILVSAVWVAFMPGTDFPFFELRLFFGVLLLWLSSYVLTSALFPVKPLDETQGLPFLEKAIFSVGLSLLLISLFGLALSYSPWGINNTLLAVCLLLLGLASATFVQLRDAKISQEKK